ncbi:hypothetical protein SAMD00019534_125300 [Acytostelium subglobosum LB1]|nr:hypothetical protein SAMD00019534_125300 [Acytostelium subglobosum LB1]GAM29354.1 hypothetical protein SAMD00019534_125300 [Acytostelium subglobosum LB1]|eukprot:XP_012747708.1 hypothetical protein SAMD00019534_125300 [Acytostelium subglobosum LB1]
MSLQQQYCSLSKQKCKPCEGGDVHRQTLEQAKDMLTQLNKEWKLIESEPNKIYRRWRMPFPKGVEFINEITTVAEEEGHHPDVSIKSYWNVEVELYTHALNGLSENDFILASKIDELPLASYVPPTRKKAAAAQPSPQ